MSGSLGDLTVRFTGDASQLAATISDVQGQLSGMQGIQSRANAAGRTGAATAASYAASLSEAGKSINKLGSGIDTVTKPLQVTSAALAAGGVAAARFAIDFENDFAKVKKTVEGTPQQLKEVKQGIIDLTTKGINGRSAIPATTKQLTELAAAGGQLGIATPNIVEFTEVMAQMESATNLGGEEGAQTMAKFMNIMKVDQGEVRNLGSAIVDLGNNYATTEADIASMSLRLGRTANVVGISAQDTLGYATALSSLGIEAEAGGSAVSRTWTKIQNATSQGGAVLNKFASISGVSAKEFKKAWNDDPSSAFNMFIKGLSQSKDLIADLQAVGINDVREGDAMKALSKGYDLVSEALERSNTAWEENIALQNEADNMAKTTAGQIQITKNNLVEAARGIGETLLPTVSKATGKVKDFAQELADMSPEAKEHLVNVASGVIAAGAGAKVLSSTAKGVGNFVDGVGKIGSAVSSLAAAHPVALAVAAGITALGAAAVGVYYSYKKAEYEAHNFGQALSDGNDEMQKQIKSADDLATTLSKRDELSQKITTGGLNTDEIEKAKSQLQELNQYLINNFGDSMSTQSIMTGMVTDDDIARLKEMIQLKKESAIIDQQTRLTDDKEKFDNAQEEIPKIQAKRDALVESNTELEKERNIISRNLNAWEQVKNSSKYPQDTAKQTELANEALAKMNAELKAAGFEGYRGFGYAQSALLELNDQYEDNIKQINKYKTEIEEYDKSSTEFRQATRAMADTLIGTLPSAMQKGGDAVADAVKQIGIYGNGANFTFDEMGNYAQQVALKLNGFNSVAEAVADKNGGLNNSVKDCVSTMQEWGYSVSQAVIQGSLLQNGFKDIASAAATDRGLEVVAEQANKLAHELGVLPKNQIIRVNAETNGFEVIDEAGNILERFNGKTTECKVSFETNGKEKIDGLKGLIDELGGEETFIMYLEAQDNATFAIDGVRYKLMSYSKDEHKAVLKAEDGATYVIDLATGKLKKLDGTEATTTTNITEGDTSGLDAAEEAEQKDGQSSDTTVNVSEGDMSGVRAAEEAESKNGQNSNTTINVTEGDTSGIQAVDEAENKNGHNTDFFVNIKKGETSGLDLLEKLFGGNAEQNITIKGTANYEMGEHPTEAPGIPGVASYTGDFSGIGDPPVKHGIVVYSETYKENAKGTQDFEGGLAMINDQKGVSDPRELVEFGGKGYIFEGRDVVLPLPKHAKVYTAAQTKEIMAARNIPHYASGKNNEAWETAKSDREHYRKTTYSIIPAWEELEWLDEMKRKFASDVEVIKEIEEEFVTYTKKMWSEDLETQQYALDMGWISQEEYYSKLAAYRDENFAPDTEEYKEATLKLHKYSVQLIDDANDVSKAWTEMRNTFNDWDEIGESPLAAYQRINERNLQAVADGKKTYQEYLDLMNDTTEIISGRADYSFNWIDHAQKYEALDADGTIAGLERVQTYVDEFFNGLGELTDEQRAIKLDLDTTLADKKMDAYADKMSEWEDDADWHQKQAEVYGWEAMGDNELDFYQRKINKYTDFANDTKLSENKRLEALRGADEMRLELYKATEDKYDDILSEAKDRMDEVKDLLDEKLSALDEKWEVEDRAEDKAETLADIEKYKNAVTIEGKEKYQEALDKLKEIEREEQRYALELENNAIMEQMQADYETLEAEKQRILEQTREANMKIASIVEPLRTLETGMNNKVDELIKVLKEEVANLKPNVTVNQTNNMTIADKTDAVLYSNKTISGIFTAYGG